MTAGEAPGITAARAYVPIRRILRTTIAEAHAWAIPELANRSKGQRAFANWDEDSVTMAVEAVRNAVPLEQRSSLRTLLLASTTLPFADRHNAGILAAALNLPEELLSLDIGGSQRAGTSALRVALEAQTRHPAIVVASERRTAKPGSIQELQWGDAAAALTIGQKDVIARFVSAASVHRDFVDHFRAAGSDYDYTWEERWVRDEGFLKIIPPVISRALAQSTVAPDTVRHLILPIPDARASRAIAEKTGIPVQALTSTLMPEIGLAGTAHPLLMLVHALERAQPGEVIVVTGFGQGCDALVLQATERILEPRPGESLDSLIARGRPESSYMRFLSFNARLPFEWGMRAELDRKTALTAQYRNEAMVTRFMAGRCRRTGAVQFPPSRIAVTPGAHHVDSLEEIPLADEPARIVSFTSDWLAYSPSPPLMYGHVQFDIGARLMMELVDADDLEIGMPLRMVFRIKDLDAARQYRRYFWKATPAPRGESAK